MEIEYEFVEALCDALANLAIERFAEKTNMLDIEKVNNQKLAFENAYTLLNGKRVEADKCGVEKRLRICNACEKKIKTFIRPANQFVRDRMGYKVNNAYFLRVEPYAKHYFELKEKLSPGLDIDKAMTALPTVHGAKSAQPVKLSTDSLTVPGNPWGKW